MLKKKDDYTLLYSKEVEYEYSYVLQQVAKLTQELARWQKIKDDADGLGFVKQEPIHVTPFVPAIELVKVQEPITEEPILETPITE